MSTSSSMKRILVTGGNKGIGKAICERLLSEWPDTCVIMGCRSEERGKEAIKDIQTALGAEKCKDRLELLVVDTSSSSSVAQAAKELSSRIGDEKLYGILNNAGIGWGYTMQETVNTNYFGPRRVNEAFVNMLKRPGGRIVNVASASGPTFLEPMSDSSDLKQKLMKPWTLPGGVGDIDEIAYSMKEGNDGYGASKALLNAYTVVHAKLEPDLLINACTPGFILTDLTAGTGAKNPPSKGAVPPCWLMMDEDSVPSKPTGRYYGSDCVRSPIHFYRGPGESPYEGNEDLVDLTESAKKAGSKLKELEEAAN